MKKNIFLLFIAFLGLTVLFNSCQPEKYELGAALTKDQLQFSITQNPADPNMVILVAQNQGLTPLWTTPVGRSLKVIDTVKLAFPGDYEFRYGVQSAGGYIQADPVSISITTTNFNYINDPLWAMLSGGAGNSKTWVLDFDENGLSRHFEGPAWWCGDETSWLEECLVPEGNCWNWKPTYAGNEWMGSGIGDYGTMTFDLIGGAHITVDQKMITVLGAQSGTYSLNTDAKTLTLTDAVPLIIADYQATDQDWIAPLQLIMLTDDFMQIGAHNVSKAEYMVFNYISVDYRDNWVPEDQPDPEPPYDGDANSDLTTDVSTTKKWVVDLDYPYNWHGLDGTELNEVATYGTDPEGFAFTTWAPPYDETVFSSVSITLTKVGDAEGTYVIENGSTTYEGSYTIDENNNIVFEEAITFFSGVGGWLSFSTTAENSLRVIKTDKDLFGNVTGVWLGARSAVKPEYFSLHLKRVAGNGGGASQGTEVTFDNTKLVAGDIEGNGNLRLELYNEYGSTNGDPPLDPASVVFDNSIEITFTLSGVTLNGGAAGSYQTSIGFADSDWSAQYWGGGSGEVSVTGNGTYTVSCSPGSAVDGALVFVIDIQGMATDISDLSSVTATIDKIVMY